MEFDGYQIALKANSPDDPTDTVYLEPNVYRNLVQFVRNLRTATPQGKEQ